MVDYQLSFEDEIAEIFDDSSSIVSEPLEESLYVETIENYSTDVLVTRLALESFSVNDISQEDIFDIWYSIVGFFIKFYGKLNSIFSRMNTILYDRMIRVNNVLERLVRDIVTIGRDEPSKHIDEYVKTFRGKRLLLVHPSYVMSTLIKARSIRTTVMAQNKKLAKQMTKGEFVSESKLRDILLILETELRTLNIFKSWTENALVDYTPLYLRILFDNENNFLTESKYLRLIKKMRDEGNEETEKFTATAIKADKSKSDEISKNAKQLITEISRVSMKLSDQVKLSYDLCAKNSEYLVDLVKSYREFLNKNGF